MWVSWICVLLVVFRGGSSDKPETASWLASPARLDLNDAFLDMARHLGQPDSTQAGRSQDVNPSPQQRLQVLDHLHELQADGTLELDDQIDVAGLLGGLAREGAEQSDPPDPNWAVSWG
jgi:hypothetical protein